MRSFALNGGILAALLSTVLALGAQESDDEWTREKIVAALDLQAAIEASEGCLGHKNMLFRENRGEATFAWFKNKDAALEWYYNAEHLHAVDALVKESGDSHEPMAHISDDAGPIMVIITFVVDKTKKPLPNLRLPMTGFAVEFYQVLPGGTSAGERFAPDKVKIPHHREMYPSSRK